jgi:hypothetical protein
MDSFLLSPQSQGFALLEEIAYSSPAHGLSLVHEYFAWLREISEKLRNFM